MPVRTPDAKKATPSKRLATWPVLHMIRRGLTFDMRGGRKWAKPACGRPLDGRVGALFHRHGKALNGIAQATGTAG
jgi:hypothetical protein